MLSIGFRFLFVICTAILISNSHRVLSQTAAKLVNRSVDTFDWNWKEVEQKSSRGVEFSPPSSKTSELIWAPGSLGPCFGCGKDSYRLVSHDCVHRMQINLTTDTYSKSLIGVFKVPDEQCINRNFSQPKQQRLRGCGPPCSQLRLLRGPLTGCRCDSNQSKAFEVPRLTCQDTRNRTVSLSLCKTIYERNPSVYNAAPCEYNVVCSQPSEWVAGNWTECSVASPRYQSREVVCATRVPTGVYLIMHSSMCVKAQQPKVNRYCARWAAEKYFKCNCSNYNASRIVICMRRDPRKKKRVPDADCNWHEKPLVSRPCTASQRSECRRRR